jgi:hypothetical protein
MMSEKTTIREQFSRRGINAAINTEFNALLDSLDEDETNAIHPLSIHFDMAIMDMEKTLDMDAATMKTA